MNSYITLPVACIWTGAERSRSKLHVIQFVARVVMLFSCRVERIFGVVELNFDPLRRLSLYIKILWSSACLDMYVGSLLLDFARR